MEILQLILSPFGAFPSPAIPRKGFSSLTMSLSGKVHALNSNHNLISSSANLQMKSPETPDGGKQAWQGEDQGTIQKRTKDSKGTSCGSFVPQNTLRGKSYYTYFKAKKYEVQEGELASRDHT